MSDKAPKMWLVRLSLQHMGAGAALVGKKYKNLFEIHLFCAKYSTDTFTYLCS